MRKLVIATLVLVGLASAASAQTTRCNWDYYGNWTCKTTNY